MNYIQATAKRGNPRFTLLGSDPARGEATVRFPRGLVCAAAMLLLAGCATLPEERPLPPPQQAIPSLHGSYHHVRKGETLWRIARSYGLEVETLARANRLPSAGHLAVGQRLFIPLPPESARFLWPLRGSLRAAGGSQGLEIAAPAGSLVRASRTGRVAVSTRRLSGWGKTVVVDHMDGYLTIYAGLHQLLVEPGAAVRQGMPVGTLSSEPLHFEIRYGASLKNALTLLPHE